MKHTPLICAAALALSACTCTCPKDKYDFQNSQFENPYTYQQPQTYNEQGSLEYYRYTQIKYIPPKPQPKQPEVIYYPVYQQPQVIYTQQQENTCCYDDYSDCAC